MKRRTLLLFLILLSACVCIAAGCSGDPKKHITVQEKTELNTDSYRQAADTPEDTEGSDSDDAHSTADSGSVDGSAGSDPAGRSSAPAPGNTLARRLDIPETNTFFREFPESSFQLSCQAEIEVPDINQVSIYKICQKPFDQAWIDQVTNVFFGDRPVYEDFSYRRATKEELLKKLRKLKAFQSKGNTDPYGYIESARKSGFQNPETLYSLEEEIADVEAAYRDAPETQQKFEVSPELCPSAEDCGSFFGIVEMDGSLFRYKLKQSPPFHMDIGITRLKTDGPDSPWSSYDWFAYPSAKPDSDAQGNMLPSRNEAEKMAGITSCQAVELADRYIEKLGLSDFSPKQVELSLYGHYYRMLMDHITYPDAAYQVIYTRDIGGFPITPGFSGGSVECADDVTLEPWGYEEVSFYINHNGLMKADIRNLYEIKEPLVDGVELLSFPEIIEIFGEMMPICFRGNIEKITIDRITLGYTRIYDPGMDSTTGLLVPVWDFFGTWTQSLDNGEPYTLDYPTRSLLTINAADGTVIDRDLGY